MPGSKLIWRGSAREWPRLRFALEIEFYSAGGREGRPQIVRTAKCVERWRQRPEFSIPGNPLRTLSNRMAQERSVVQSSIPGMRGG